MKLIRKYKNLQFLECPFEAGCKSESVPIRACVKGPMLAEMNTFKDINVNVFFLSSLFNYNEEIYVLCLYGNIYVIYISIKI